MDTIIVAAIVILAAFFVLRRFFRISRKQETCGYGCSGCAADPGQCHANDGLEADSLNSQKTGPPG